MKLLRWLVVFLGFTAVMWAADADFKTGDRVEAKSYSSWYKATIIDVRANEWKVTYDGYASNWDEWVGPDKIRALAAKPAAAVTKLATPMEPAGPGQWKSGDRVEALSSGRWYGARIIEAEASRWKVTYDGYSSSSDEWVSLDRLRAPGAKTAGGGAAAAKPVEKYAFPARPAGAKAGLEGAFLRVETYYWGTSLSLSNQGWFFTKDGRFSKEPAGGFSLKDFAATKEARKADGVYWIKDGKITFAWADGSAPTEAEFENKGDEVRWGGLGATRVKPFRKGWRFDGDYEGGASIGGMAASTTVVFRADGTFARSSIGTFSSTSSGTTVSGGAQSEAAGSYEFDGYTLTLAHKGGDTQKFTVFAFGDEDAAGRPQYIYREGTMMKRQK